MYVRVQVKAGAKKESVIETDAKTFSIAVKEPAAQNLANMRVREVLARLFGVPVPAVRMISGHRAPRKIYDIDA